MKLSEDDKRLAIVLILGGIGLFIYPLVILIGAAVLAIPFVYTRYTYNRCHTHTLV